MESDLRLLGFVAAIRAFGFFMFQAFLSLYLHNVLGLSFALVGTLILAYGIPPLVISPVAGLLTDRFGRRRLLLLALAGEAGGALFLAYGMLVGSLWLVSAAVTLGFLFGQAFGPPANSAYVADLAEGSERTRGFTWIRVGFNAGAGVGVALGGLLVGIIGFPAVAALASLFIGAATVLVAVRLHPSPYDARLRESRSSRKAEGSSVAPPGPSPSRAPLEHPSMRHSLGLLIADRAFLEVCLAFALAALVGGQWAVTFQLYVNSTLGLPYDLIGVGLALNCVIVVVGQTATTRSMLGRRHTWVGGLGTVLYVVSFLAIGASGEWGIAPVVVFFAAVIVSTMGENFFAIPQTTLPSNLSPEREIGNYNAAFQTVTGAAWLLSVFFGGLVLSLVPDSMLEWIILMSPAVPCLLLLRHVARRIPEKANRA